MHDVLTFPRTGRAAVEVRQQQIGAARFAALMRLQTTDLIGRKIGFIPDDAFVLFTGTIKGFAESANGELIVELDSNDLDDLIYTDGPFHPSQCWHGRTKPMIAGDVDTSFTAAFPVPGTLKLEAPDP